MIISLDRLIEHPWNGQTERGTVPVYSITHVNMIFIRQIMVAHVGETLMVMRGRTVTELSKGRRASSL